MKEIPVLFSGPMVRANLRPIDPKTMTRRVVKWRGLQPGLNLSFTGLRAHQYPAGWVLESDSRTSSEWRCSPTPCPYGLPGDRLWVRETFFAFGRWETRFSVKKGRDEWHFLDMTQECGRAYQFEEPPEWKKRNRSGRVPDWWKRPAIFMPQTVSRILLEVVAVRIERLQDISEADAIAEGCTQNHNGYTGAAHTLQAG